MPLGVPGKGLTEGTSVAGWKRVDEQGVSVPCGCGGIQRPDPDATAVGDDIVRVFVCVREECDRRTVERANTAMEADR